MTNISLADYIDNARKVKLPERQIYQNLLNEGWDKKEIENELKGTSSFPSRLVVPNSLSSTPENHLWDAFEHILLFISLGILAISSALMLHAFVDKWVSSNTTQSASSLLYISSYGHTLIRGYIAAIVVSYPLFSFFFLRISKRTLNNPQIQGLKSRKVLIYLTLILTFFILIFNIISIIYSFLNGNVTLNFLSHFSVSVLISSFIFGYYLHQVKKDRKIYD